MVVFDEELVKGVAFDKFLAIDDDDDGRELITGILRIDDIFYVFFKN
jgi:hypothetical protein